MTNKEIANEILPQLGGKEQLVSMIGAYDFEVIELGIKFKFQLCEKANVVQIVLNGMDYYDINFFKIDNNNRMQNVGRLEDVDCTTIIDELEEFTGLIFAMVRPTFG